jgi:hypothetical protein
MFTLYKDTFLSNWGQAPRGSYVVVKGTTEREEFRLIRRFYHLREIPREFLNVEGRHIVAAFPKGKTGFRCSHALNRYTHKCMLKIAES